MCFSALVTRCIESTENSYGIGFPIIGKTESFSDFIWIGFPELKQHLK